MSSAAATPTGEMPEKQLKAVIVTLNQYFEKDAYFKRRGTFPIQSLDELFLACADAVVLCRLAMFVSPGCIPAQKIATDIDLEFIRCRVMNKSRRVDDNTRSVFHITQNLNLFRTAAQAINECSNIKITTQDILDINYVTLLRALITILRAAIVARVTLLHNPALIRLREPGESVDAFQLLTPEQLLIRWVNYQLRRAAYPTSITNLASDFKDSGVFLALIKQVVPPNKIDGAAFTAALQVAPSRPERPVLVAETVAKLGCAADITVEEIISGDRSAILTLLAAMFYRYPCLEFPTEEEFKEMEETIKQLRIRVQELEKEVEYSRQYKDLMKELDEMTQESAQIKKDNAALKQKISLTEAENAYFKDKVQETKDAVEKEKQRSRIDRENLREHNRAEVERIRKELVARQMQGVDDKFKGIAETYEEMLETKDRVIEELKALRMEAEQDLEAERERKAPSEQSLVKMQQAIEKLKEELDQAHDQQHHQDKPHKRVTIAGVADDDDDDGSFEGTTTTTSRKVSVKDLQVESLEDNLNDLEDELEEEKKAFELMIQAQKGSSESVLSDSGKKSSSKNGNTKKTLEELFAILEDYLGEDAVQTGGSGSSLSARVKNLVMYLLKEHQDLTEKHKELEKQWYKKKDIDVLMKRKLDNYILDQIHQSQQAAGGKKKKGSERPRTMVLA